MDLYMISIQSLCWGVCVRLCLYDLRPSIKTLLSGDHVSFVGAAIERHSPPNCVWMGPWPLNVRCATTKDIHRAADVEREAMNGAQLQLTIHALSLVCVSVDIGIGRYMRVRMKGAQHAPHYVRMLTLHSLLYLLYL